jgi:hypothetical protein
MDRRRPEIRATGWNPEVRVGAGLETSRWRGDGRFVAVVDGAKARTRAGLFREFARALKFPSYFAKNWDALEECISDLGWLGSPSGYGVEVRSAERLLSMEPDDQMRILGEILRSAAGTFSREISLGEDWDRGVRSFDVRLLISEESQADAAILRWRNTGILL